MGCRACCVLIMWAINAGAMARRGDRGDDAALPDLLPERNSPKAFPWLPPRRPIDAAHVTTLGKLVRPALAAGGFFLCLFFRPRRKTLTPRPVCRAGACVNEGGIALGVGPRGPRIAAGKRETDSGASTRTTVSGPSSGQVQSWLRSKLRARLKRPFVRQVCRCVSGRRS